MKPVRLSNSQAAFTLLELLIVVCILAILCGLAITRFNMKNTTEAAWSTVHESAYKAAQAALAKALAENPNNPPQLVELARSIDTKKTIYVTNCGNAPSPSPTTNGGLCLGIDINGNEFADASEIFAAAYTNTACDNIAQNQGDEICCLERPSFNVYDPGTLSVFTGSFF